MSKIAVIQDLSCWGRASLTVSIPLLSRMGFQVVPLPTSLLSAHSEYEGFARMDLTEMMHKTLRHWQKLQLHFDAIYSGYLSSALQVEVLLELIHSFGEGIPILVDPVMGDHGALYSGLEEANVVAMRTLCRHADIITPNGTEAALLLGEAPNSTLTPESAKEWCARLSAMGPTKVVITSAYINKMRELVTLAYDAPSYTYSEIAVPLSRESFPGTGDTFAAILLGALLEGNTLTYAAERAVSFIAHGIEVTREDPGYNPLDGINQEETAKRFSI